MADVPVGVVVRAVRERRGYSQNYLAKRIGCNRMFVLKVEHDKHSIQIDTLMRFAAALDIEGWRLLRYAEKLKNQTEVA
jgi:transcriptional regulator with XRE-family HTH domain